MQGGSYPTQFLGSGAFGAHSGLIINGSLFSGNGGGFGQSYMGATQIPGHQGPRGVSPYSGTRQTKPIRR